MSGDYYDDSLDSDNNLPQYARITFFGQVPYIMQKERVIIGRNSAAGSVDIDVGAVTFVSRKHLELTYSYQKLKVKCLGKNGIFIDNIFKSHSFIPYELPSKCTLRFPSTDVQFCVEQLVGIKSSERGRSYGRMKNSLRYVTDNDESPEYKRMKIQSRSDQDSVSNDNQEGAFNGLKEVICNMSDNEVEEYIHNDEDDDDQKINTSECDGLMNDANEENEGVLIDNIGAYSLDANGSITTLTKDYTLENMKSNDMNSTNILRGIDNQSNISNRNVAKLFLSNLRCSNDQYYTNTGQITVLDTDDLTIEHGSDTQKPPYSYAQLIVQAVSTARDRQLTLNGIYNYISKNYPYFKAHDKGWQNSVRHNLSLNRYFIKVPRGQDEPGKGSFWRVDPAYENKLIAQAFRKRRLRNNASGIVNEDGIVSQVLNVSNIDANSQVSNTKVFGINKSGQIPGRTSNFGNVITLKRACDINTQNGGTTYVLNSSSALSSNNEPQKYIVSNRNNSNFESLSNISSNKTGTIFKCQSSKTVYLDGNNIKISGTTGVVSKNRGLQIRSQGNNPGTLISLGGKLFSTANIKSLQIQQQSHPRILTSNSSFDPSNSNKSSINNTINPKGNNFYIISPSGIKNQKTLNSSFDDNIVHNSLQSPITISNSNRRIINLQTQSPNIRKIDLSNGSMNKESDLKSPIILKKVKINNNFLTLKSEPKINNIRQNQDSVNGDVNMRYSIQNCDKNFNDNLSDEDIKLQDESDSQVFISDRDIDNSEMDHFLISHSDPSVSGLPLQEHSEPGSSPDLYKHDDDMWPEDEVHKMESLKYSMHDGIVDTECD